MVTPIEAAPGLLAFLVIIVLSQFIHEIVEKLAPAVKLPTALYIIFVGMIVTYPGLLPCSDFVNVSVGKVSMLSMCTPILAYSGISAAKDLKTFKAQGVAIVLTTLFALAGTFLGSAVIAQLVMKATGVF